MVIIMYYYSNLFFLYAILGHLLEKILFPEHASGILYGFWTPIYGIGALIILFSFRFLEKKFTLSKVSKFFITFLIGAVFLSFIEWVGGNLIEILFHITFWDYSDMKYSFGKYASLEMSIVWGIASLLLIYVIEPLRKKLPFHIPKAITYILFALFATDLVATLLFKTK